MQPTYGDNWFRLQQLAAGLTTHVVRCCRNRAAGLWSARYSIVPVTFPPETPGGAGTGVLLFDDVDLGAVTPVPVPPLTGFELTTRSAFTSGFLSGPDSLLPLHGEDEQVGVMSVYQDDVLLAQGDLYGYTYDDTGPDREVTLYSDIPSSELSLVAGTTYVVKFEETPATAGATADELAQRQELRLARRAERESA